MSLFLFRYLNKFKKIDRVFLCYQNKHVLYYNGAIYVFSLQLCINYNT